MKNKKLLSFLVCLLISLTLIAQETLIAHAGADRELCYGSSTVLGGSQIATGGVTPYTYNWGTSTSLSSTTVAHPVANPTVSTTYILTVTDVLNNAARDTVIVTVFDITLYAHAGKDITKCQFTELIGGDSLTAIGGKTPYEYLWTNNSGDTVAAVARPSLFVDTSRTFYLRVIDNVGCISVDSFHLTVSTPLHAYGLTDTTLHLGEGVILRDTVIGGTGNNFDFAWSPNKWLDDTTTENPVCTPLSSQQYKLVVTDSRGCTDVTFSTITYEPINFGQLSSFAAFAVDSITAGDSAYFIGNIGSTFIDTTYMRIYGERHTGTDEIENLSTALNELTQTLNEMEGESINGDFGEEKINAGIYTISGDASFNQTLTLQGNEASLFVFNISGDLTVGDTAHLILEGVASDKVFFNIGGSLRLGENPELYGSYLIGERVVGGGFWGKARITCKKSVELTGESRSYVGPYGYPYDPYYPCDVVFELPDYPHIHLHSGPNNLQDWTMVFNAEFSGAIDTTSDYYQSLNHTWYIWGGDGDKCKNIYFSKSVNNYVLNTGNSYLDLELLRLIPSSPNPPVTCIDNNLGQSFTADFSGTVFKTSSSFYHGYFEIRAKIPGGDGLWPAFWLIGDGGCTSTKSNYREIDWFDWDFKKAEDIMGIVNHCGGTDYAWHTCPVKHGTSNQWVDMSQAYHIYAGEWSYNSITFYVDGVPMITSPNYLINDEKMSLVLSNSVCQGPQSLCGWNGQTGVNDPTSITGTATDDRDFIIDWARVWQKSDDLLDYYFVDGCSGKKLPSGATFPVESGVIPDTKYRIETNYYQGATYSWGSSSSNLHILPGYLNNPTGCYFYGTSPGTYYVYLQVYDGHTNFPSIQIPVTIVSNPLPLSTPVIAEYAYNPYNHPHPDGNYFCISPLANALYYEWSEDGGTTFGQPTFNTCFVPSNYFAQGAWMDIAVKAFYYDCDPSSIGHWAGYTYIYRLSQDIPDSIPNTEVKIYPSPSDGRLRIQNDTKEKIQVTISTISGINLFEFEIDGRENKEVNDLPEGMLIFTSRREGDNVILSRRLIPIIK